ncbi:MULTISPECIES: hypothetical protein [unclassified Erythrobacter]|nr:MULTISPECIES: hypothetical protein [unclassified Erythrobacter]
MCNLYRMTKNKDEVAKWFDAIDDLAGANFGAEVSAHSSVRRLN